jgi:hypothetical protein
LNEHIKEREKNEKKNKKFSGIHLTVAVVVVVVCEKKTIYKFRFRPQHMLHFKVDELFPTREN